MYKLTSIITLLTLILIPIHGEVLGGPLGLFIVIGLYSSGTSAIIAYLALIVIVGFIVTMFIHVTKSIRIIQFISLYIFVAALYYTLLNDPSIRITFDTIIISILCLTFSLLSMFNSKSSS